MNIYTFYKSSQQLTETAKHLIHTTKYHLDQISQRLKVDKNKWNFTKDHLYQKPWFLVLGPFASGKSSLIDNAELNFTQIIRDNNDRCRSIISQDAVYLDFPSDTISDKDLLSAWQTLYQTIKTVRRKKPLDGIILTLNIQHLIAQTKLQREA